MSSCVNSCPKCLKNFKSVKGLKIHLSKCKEIEKSVQCELCKVFLKEERYLKSHYKTKQHLDNVEKNNAKEKDLQEEKRQLTQSQPIIQPQIINNYYNNTYNNNNSSNQTIIHNTFNYKPFTLEAAKNELTNFSKTNRYIDENDICKRTIDKLAKFVFYADQSRGKLAFYDDVNGDKVKVKDKGGILIAEKIYDALNSNFKEILETLNNTKDPREFLMGDYIQIKTIHDYRKELANNIISKNPHSKARFGKAVIKNLSKFHPNDYIDKFKTITKFGSNLHEILTEHNFSNLFYEFEALGLLIKQRIQFEKMETNYIHIKDDKDKITEINKNEFFQYICYILKETVKESFSEILDACQKHNDLEKIKNWTINQNIILQKLSENELNKVADNLFFNLTLR